LGVRLKGSKTDNKNTRGTDSINFYPSLIYLTGLKSQAVFVLYLKTKKNQSLEPNNFLAEYFKSEN
jgi:hypothetical protein